SRKPSPLPPNNPTAPKRASKPSAPSCSRCALNANSSSSAANRCRTPCTTSDLVDAQDELTLKRVILQRRLVDIYKRGPLFSLEVLLSANSFGDLIARYKYLHLIALRDRVLVHRVEDLRNQIDRQRGNLVRFQNDMEENRQEKSDEEKRLRDLQSQQA